MALQHARDLDKSYLKNASDSRWSAAGGLHASEKCSSASGGLRFFIGVRLALGCDLLLLRWLLSFFELRGSMGGAVDANGFFSCWLIEDPCSKLQGSSTVRNAVFFMIRSLTLPQAAGSALAFAVQSRHFTQGHTHCVA